MTPHEILMNELNIKAFIAVITNLVFSTDKVALRVAANVFGEKFRRRLKGMVKSVSNHRILVCFDNVLGESQ